jgi:uracil-DNA glycosylase
MALLIGGGTNGGYDRVPLSWRPILSHILETPEARRLGGFLRAEEDAGKHIFRLAVSG